MQSTFLTGPSSHTKTTEDPSIDSGQQHALDMMQGGANVFLTGMAGTGKSHTLLDFISKSFKRTDVCATTGIAALNLQETFRQRVGIPLPAFTIYRWSGIGLGPAKGQSFEDYWRFLNKEPIPRSRHGAFARIRAAECLIIDEISMLPGRILDYLDFQFKKLRENDKPFGGIQVICVGDWLQLPPVAKNQVYDWAFLSDAWKRANFLPAYLTTIHRQDEPEFVNALNAFRLGQVSESVARTLKTRVKMFVDRKVVRLMTHNVQVDKWNAYQIGEIDSPERTYQAKFEGPDFECDFLRKNLVTPETLVLKKGTRVMVTVNIASQEANQMLAVNGSCGEVVDMMDDGVFLKLDDGTVFSLPAHEFRFDPQRNDSGTMMQIPLRPAYAMTIHKSQGLTLDSAYIDIRAAREPGQAYVALSRLRSLSGLYLKDWIKGVVVSEAAINFYKQLEGGR